MQLDLNNIDGLVRTIIRALPALLAYLVIIQLAWGRFRAWKSPISPTDAAYTLVAVAAFAYVLRV
jgi:hypothetical protein